MPRPTDPNDLGDLLPLDEVREELRVEDEHTDGTIVTLGDPEHVEPIEAAKMIAKHIPSRDDQDYRRVAFELALILGPQGCVEFGKFAEVVKKYTDI